MTDIQVWLDGGVEIDAKGHADYNPDGPDIVCAGVSALLCTWRECLASLEAQGLLYSMSINADDGRFRACCVPTAEAEGYVLASVATILTGLALLEASYPAHVRLKIHDSDGEKNKNDADTLYA